MRVIILTEKFSVDRVGYTSIFMRILGSKDFIFTQNSQTDCLIRAPFLLKDMDDPESVIFKPGDIIKVTIELEEK